MATNIEKIGSTEVSSNSGLEYVVKTIQTKGAIIIQNIIPKDSIQELKDALIKCLDEDAEKWGESYIFFGMVHALMSRNKTFRDLIEREALLKIIRGVLGHGAIIHAYNSSSMPPNKTNFSRSIHVDCPRLIPNYITNLGMTLALDPFTNENGAMEIYPSSFVLHEPPNETDFISNCTKLNDIDAGDALFFNARCWHRGGINTTEKWRHSVTMNCCRAFMRQQFYFPEMFTEAESSNFSEDLKQMLGYHVRMPKNMEDFLLPAPKRLYKPGQE